VVGLEALTTFKRVSAWIPGPVEDTDTFLWRLRRLSRGLETAYWRVYEHKEESNGVRLVLSIYQDFVATLERLQWKPFSGVAKAVFSLLGAKPQKKRDTPTEAVKVVEVGVTLMVSSLTFIQANMQHSIFASRIFARTVSGKGIDVALIQEPWYRERGLNILGYTLHSAGRGGQAQRVRLGEMRVQLDSARVLRQRSGGSLGQVP
jgi:hypothetical protein